MVHGSRPQKSLERVVPGCAAGAEASVEDSGKDEREDGDHHHRVITPRHDSSINSFKTSGLGGALCDNVQALWTVSRVAQPRVCCYERDAECRAESRRW